MSDLNRLLADQPTDLERTLLRAAARERPSSQQRVRVRRALGLGTWPAFIPRWGICALRMPKLAAACFVAVLVAGAMSVVALAAHRLRDTPLALPESPGAMVAVKSPAEPPVQMLALPSGGDSGSSVVEPAAGARRAYAKPAPAMSSEIREQIRMIDQVHSLLAMQDATGALRAVDLYTAKFPGGAFTQEAAVLRIEALDQTGDHARAATLARAFIARNPSSPHVARLERMAGH